MGFHTCHLCNKAHSSGEITLRFASGNSYHVPDMITHYVSEHGYRPPDPFIRDVETSFIDSGKRHQDTSTEVGWLDPEKGFLTWPTEEQRDLFAGRLERVMRHATSLGMRRQTRGLDAAKPE